MKKGYRLGEIFDLQMGKTPSRNDPRYWCSGGNKWVSVGDLSRCGKYISETKETISDVAVAENGMRIIPSDTVIMSFKLSIGKTAITAEPMYSNEAIMSFISRQVIEVFPDYFYYLFRSKDWSIGANKAVMGKTLNKSTLSNIRIKIHTSEEQRKIAGILDIVRNMIEVRKKQLQVLDTLIKARFVEMFGDTIHNAEGWDTCSVENACSEIYGGGTPSKSHPEYYEDGDIPWVSSKDMKSDVLYGSQICINQLGVDNSTAKLVPVNSVIMVIRSGILKHTLPVAINAVPITVNQDLKVFIPSEKILTRFLAMQFKMQEKDILTGVRAVTADNIEFNSLKQRRIILPPVEFQQQYVEFCQQVDKSKVVVQKALDEAQLLFDSLLQKYFG